MGKLPGYETGITATPREIAFGSSPLELHPGGIVVDGTTGIDGGNTGYTAQIRAGWAMGRITSTGQYVPCKRTLVNGSGESSSTGGDFTKFTVDNSYPFAVGDVLTITNPSTGAVVESSLTITAIDYTTHRITVNDPVNVTDNYLCHVTNGAETCRGFLNEFTNLRNDQNTAAADKTANLVVGGELNQAYLLGDIAAILADASSLTALGGRLRIFNPSTGLYTL